MNKYIKLWLVLSIILGYTGWVAFGAMYVFSKGGDVMWSLAMGCLILATVSHAFLTTRR